MSDSEEETKDKQLKIAILGDGSAGKVSKKKKNYHHRQFRNFRHAMHYIVFHNNW